MAKPVPNTVVGVAAGMESELDRDGEWPAILDVDSLLATGWRPTPFRQFLLKVHSRCNLACDYCYVYTKADQTWQTRPRKMSPALLSVAAERIAEHARTHNLESVQVIFHGGEPLLSGANSIVDGLRKVRAAVDARVSVHSAVQTNGILLTKATLDLLASMDIKVGVSLDGNVAAHDRRRHYQDGKGSYAEVARALKLLSDYPSIYSGLLSVVDLDADPIITYETLLEFAPPIIDFLLPHHNWANPPMRPAGASAPYADWLAEVFDRWYGAPSQETRVRLFEEIIHLLLGGDSKTEVVGLSPSGLIVVETDGSIEQTDALKSAYEGASATGLHITRDAFDAALRDPGIAARQLGTYALSDVCQICSVKPICGAGLYAHRYRPGTGFRNPSVYCPDLYALITHIRTCLIRDLQRIRRSLLEEDGNLYAKVLALSGSGRPNFWMFVAQAAPILGERVACQVRRFLGLTCDL